MKNKCQQNSNPQGFSPVRKQLDGLSQNILRHMRNTSKRLPIEERIEVVNSFTQRLANSGYQREQARRVVVPGLKGYEAARRSLESGCTGVPSQ